MDYQDWTVSKELPVLLEEPRVQLVQPVPLASTVSLVRLEQPESEPLARQAQQDRQVETLALQAPKEPSALQELMDYLD
jgi:hypothetical protein